MTSYLAITAVPSSVGMSALSLPTVSLHGRRTHWHHEWEAGAAYALPWFQQLWVETVRDFYCDDACENRLLQASTIDREFKALVDLFNQTTGGPREVYRGAFEGLQEGLPPTSRSLWKQMEGWSTILTAHTSTMALCTVLKLEGNVSFTRQLCYDNINASSVGPLFPDPRWSIIEDCCLKFNRTVNRLPPELSLCAN